MNKFEARINFECDICHDNEVGPPLLGHLKQWGPVMPIMIWNNEKNKNDSFFICEKCFNKRDDTDEPC